MRSPLIPPSAQLGDAPGPGPARRHLPRPHQRASIRRRTGLVLPDSQPWVGQHAEYRPRSRRWGASGPGSFGIGMGASLGCFHTLTTLAPAAAMTRLQGHGDDVHVPLRWRPQPFEIPGSPTPLISIIPAGVVSPSKLQPCPVIAGPSRSGRSGCPGSSRFQRSS